jgi:hypothetical protein
VVPTFEILLRDVVQAVEHGGEVVEHLDTLPLVV